MSGPLGPAAPDFLDRLVDSARGEGGGLRPRLPSFFESSRLVRMDTTAEADSAGRVGERVPDTPGMARDGAHTHTPMNISRASAVAATPTLRPLESAPSSETVAVMSPELPTPALAASARRSIEPPGAPEVEDGLAPTPRLRALMAPLAAVVRDSAPTRDGALAPRAPGEVPSNPRESPQVSAVRSSRRALVDERASDAPPVGHPPAKVGALLPSAEPAVRALLVETQATRRRSISEAAGVERSADAPIVNVTIGRVEVRAVPAPTTPRQQQPQGPRPMSLAEYLAQRSGGR